MDTFASLALATEPPTDALLEREPHNRNEYIVSRKMFKHIIGQSIYQMIIILLFVFAGEKFLPEYPNAKFDNVIHDEIKGEDYEWRGEEWKIRYSDPA